ncbi:uncharacterized protein LOC142527104 [Primulina tabacum]|uniref:uncharacterized protein LOC142527104 n=1 Tax=Primulina tabacum TaxID=48773 RepID=UPI003F595D85
MESTVRIELWHGGKFDEQHNNLYRGGNKFVIPDVDLDMFCLDDLFDMLKAAGGQQMNVHFFFQLPKNAFTTEMVKIVGDAEIRTMFNCFRNHSVITLWSQENNFTPLKDAIIGVGCNPSDDTKAGPQVMNASDDNERGTSESFGSDPIDDNDIGLDDVSIGDDEDSLDGSFHESDEDVDSDSSTENDAGDYKRRSQPKPHNEKATECWYSDIELEDELISLASSDDDDSCPKHHVFSERMNMKMFELAVGMKFKDVHEFRRVLVDWTVRSGVELVFKKNEKRRVTAVCKAGCEWRLHASLVMGGPTFQIKTLTGKHTCVRASSNKLATYKYLSKRIEMIVCENPTIPVDNLKRLIRRKCNVDVSEYKAYMAKKAALEKLKGKFKDQYLKLWDYCETVRKYNPGSKILVKRDHSFSVPTFQRMYFSLQALKSGFLAGCRPVIGLDGCFLKTNYGGQLLVAIGRDGNVNVFLNINGSGASGEF